MLPDWVKLLLYAAGGLSLLVCLGSAVFLFLGVIDASSFKSVFLVSSIVWFGTAGTVGSLADEGDR